MADEVSWPVVIVSGDDRFLHIAGDEAELRRHVRADAKAALSAAGYAGDVVLDCFDSTGRRLRPVLGTAWLPRGFEPTAEAIDPAELLRRMVTAAESAEQWERLRRQHAAEAEGVPTEVALLRAEKESPTAPVPHGPDVAAYARAILTEMSRQATFGGPPGEVDQGGWLHNAWHAAFG
jgi:hypothetical protein